MQHSPTDQKPSAQSQELFHLIIENVRDYAIFMTDTDGRVESWNPGVERLLGYTESEIVGQSVAVIFTAEDVAAGAPRKEMELAAATGRAEDKRWHRRRDGSVFWANGIVSPLKNADGTVRGFAKIMRDDTAQKLAEENLEQTKRHVENILESINDGFYALDTEWRFTYINRHSERLTGRAREELIGKVFWDAFPATVGTTFEEHYRRAVREQQPVTFEEFYAPLGGWFELRVYPSPSGLSLYFHDVTTRKRRERNLVFLAALQKDFARFASVGEVTHVAGERIAAHLDLSHCLFVEINEAANEAEVFHDQHRADVPSLVGVYRLEEFHTPKEIARLSAGKAVVINNVRDAPRSAEAAAEFESLGIRALANSPYVSDGRWKFTLSAQRGQPYHWRADELELLDALAARVYLRIERARAETVLRESEERFRALQQATPDGFMIFESVRDTENQITDFRWVYVNPAAERIVGRAQADLLGKHLCAEMPGNRADGLFDEYARVVETGVVWQKEFGYRHENLDHYFLSTAVRVGDGFAVGFSDISERKRAELNLIFLAEISQDLAHLGSVSEIMHAVGAKIGAHLHLSMCNFVEIKDTADEATINHSWSRTGAPPTVGVYRIADFVNGEFLEASRAGEMFVVGDTQTDRRVSAEKYAARDIGALLSVPSVAGSEWRFLLVVYHHEPHAWHADEIELLRELTTRVWTRLERARAEDAVRESRQKLQTALDAGRLGSWEFDLTNAALTVSESCKSIYGRMPHDKFTYQDLNDAILSEDQAAWRAAIETAINQCAEFEIEYRVRWLDNTVHWVLVRGRCFADESGAVNSLTGVSVDVTERKEIEAARETVLQREQELRQTAESANRLKDEFLATLSHELRTPLNSILGWSQMLQTRNFGETDQKKALATIERSARSQSQLIDDLLDVSRIITGKLRLDVRGVDLPNVISAAVDAARPAAEAKNIRLQTLLDPNAGPISGDPDRLQQIVWNLLSNAVKFTPKDGRVQVRLERVNSHVEIVVSDTGKGIEPEFLPHVFDRFRQSDGSMTRRHGGLGLGLAIVRQLVELHGGTVSVNSAGEDKGATFTVVLPLLPVRHEPASDAPRVHPAAPEKAVTAVQDAPELSGLRVLLVDDEADSRELLNLVLASHGANITVAASAAEAFEKIKSAPFDIIISDIGMPEEDGFSLIGKIRMLPTEQNGSIPAIALTAYARPEDRVQALRSGFQMHIAKPVEPDELIVTVANLAGRIKSSKTLD